MKKLTKNRVQKIIELHEYYTSGYKNLSGCFVHVFNIHKDHKVWVANVQFIEQEENCTDVETFNECEYPEKVIRQLERKMVKSKLLRERK
jgi:hypothetical protein